MASGQTLGRWWFFLTKELVFENLYFWIPFLLLLDRHPDLPQSGLEANRDGLPGQPAASSSASSHLAWAEFLIYLAPLSLSCHWILGPLPRGLPPLLLEQQKSFLRSTCLPWLSCTLGDTLLLLCQGSRGLNHSWVFGGRASVGSACTPSASVEVAAGPGRGQSDTDLPQSALVQFFMPKRRL